MYIEPGDLPAPARVPLPSAAPHPALRTVCVQHQAQLQRGQVNQMIVNLADFFWAKLQIFALIFFSSSSVLQRYCITV